MVVVWLPGVVANTSRRIDTSPRRSFHRDAPATTRLSKKEQDALMRWPEIYKIPIFPADTVNKTVNFKGWPDKDFSKINFRKEMLKGAYDNGVAARLGLTLDGKLYAVALDFDGWDAVIAWFESCDRVLALSQKTLVEWHQDKGKGGVPVATWL
jgi:hypothetical protein